MSLISRVDANQKAIVAELRKRGYSVMYLHTLGEGRPDIAVGCHGRNFLFEIKNPKQSGKKKQLRPNQKTFAEEWRGQVSTVFSADDVVNVIALVVNVIALK